MARGVAHPPELRAEVIAAVRAGASISHAAARFSVDRTLVWRWTQTATSVATMADEREPAPEGLEQLTERIAGHVVETITEMRRLGLIPRAQRLR
jgi:transposase-like protein